MSNKKHGYWRNTCSLRPLSLIWFVFLIYDMHLSEPVTCQWWRSWDGTRTIPQRIVSAARTDITPVPIMVIYVKYNSFPRILLKFMSRVFGILDYNNISWWDGKAEWAGDDILRFRDRQTSFYWYDDLIFVFLCFENLWYPWNYAMFLTMFQHHGEGLLLTSRPRACPMVGLPSGGLILKIVIVKINFWLFIYRDQEVVWDNVRCLKNGN